MYIPKFIRAGMLSQSVQVIFLRAKSGAWPCSIQVYACGFFSPMAVRTLVVVWRLPFAASAHPVAHNCVLCLVCTVHAL